MSGIWEVFFNLHSLRYKTKLSLSLYIYSTNRPEPSDFGPTLVASKDGAHLGLWAVIALTLSKTCHLIGPESGSMIYSTLQTLSVAFC